MFILHKCHFLEGSKKHASYNYKIVPKLFDPHIGILENTYSPGRNSVLLVNIKVRNIG